MSLLERIQPHTTGGKIFEAATQLFQEHGYKKVTISDITAAAGVGKGTLYLYWPSKQDLVLALIASEMIRIMDQLRTVLETEPHKAMPSRLALQVLSAASRRSMFASLNSDPALLDVLAQRPQSYEILRQTSFTALISAAIPKMREARLISTRLSVQEQLLASHTLMAGAVELTEAPQLLMTSLLHQQMPQIQEPTFLKNAFEVLLGEDTEGKEQELTQYAQWLIHLVDGYIQRLAKVLYPLNAQDGKITDDENPETP